MLELIVRLVLGGGVLLGALFALRAAAARGMTARGGPALRVLGRTGLTRSALVAVVAVDDRRFLLGAGDHGVVVLAELDPLDQRTVDDVALDHDALADLASGPGHADLQPGLAGAATAALPAALRRARRAPAWRGLAHAVATHDLPDGAHGTGATTHGPRIGPLDRLRALTVRTPTREPVRAAAPHP